MDRHFLPWTEPFLPQAAAALIERHASPVDGVRGGAASGARGGAASGVRGRAASGARGPGVHEADLRGVWVVVPGARAGRRLKELLAEHAGRHGVRLIPPEIMTVGVLGRRLTRHPHPPASSIERLLTWGRALGDLSPDALGQLVARGPEDPERIGAWSSLARQLDRLSRTVASGGLRFADVARRLQDDGRPREAARWSTLGQVQLSYEAALLERERCDPDLVRIGVQPHPPEHLASVWLLGLAELNPVTRAQLAAIRVPLHALVHAPAARADDFDDLGCVRTEIWRSAHLSLPDDRIEIAASPDEQARCVVERLAALAPNLAPEEVLIGVPDPEVVPYLEAQLETAGVAVRSAAGEALRDTAPWRLLAAIADVLDSARSFESVAALLRHPDIERWLDLERDPLSALDRWATDHVPARMIAPYPGTTDDAALVRSVMQRLDAALLSLWGGERPLSAWAPVIRGVLLEIYEGHEPEGSSRFGQRMTRIFAAIEQSLQSLEAVADELAPACPGSSALRLLLDDCAGTSIPAPVDERAVELLGWLELHLDDAPATLITGLNEGALPESVRGDLFLPDALRTRIGLEDNEQRYARDLYRLTAILHSRRELVLVSGRRRASGDPLRPSRLLFAAPADEVTRRVRRFFDPATAEPDPQPSPHDEGDGAPADADRAAEAPPTSARGFQLPPQPQLVLPEPVTSLSVTDFRQLLADPYGWALTRVLELEPLRDDIVELDAARFGSLAHGVLERFGRDEIERHANGDIELDPTRIAQRLDAVLDGVVARRFTGTTRIGVELQIEQLRGRLHAFAEGHAAWLEQGWRVRAVEVGTPQGGLPLVIDPEAGSPAEPRRIGIRARIDRIDEHPGLGEWAIFDYKTSDIPADPDRAHRKGRSIERRWIDLQLPLYRWLVAQGLPGLPRIAPERIRVGFIALSRELSFTEPRLVEWSAAEFEQALEVARATVRGLLEGPIRHDPALRPAFAPPELEALLGLALIHGDAADDTDSDPGAAE